jgi:hypothetical protein
MGDESQELDERELEVASMVMDGESFATIGLRLGILRQSAWKVAQRPHVAAFIEQASRARQIAVTRRMQASGERAVDVLRELADDVDQPGAVRVSAARALLEPTIIKAPVQVDATVSAKVDLVAMLAPQVAALGAAELDVLARKLDEGEP